MKRKLILTTFLVVTLISIFAISVGAAEPVKTWDISATESDSVTAYLYDDTGNEGYYTVIISGTGAMKNNSAPWKSSSLDYTIKTVIIEEGVTNVGNNSFAGCLELSNLELPSSIVSIGNSAFSNCDSLRRIIIPKGVISIGESAFSSSNSLDHVVIPNSVATIGERAFAYNGIFYNDYTNIYIEAGAITSGWNPRWNYEVGRVVSGIYEIREDGLMMKKSSSNTLSVIIYMGNDKNIVIPSQIDDMAVTSIYDSAFDSCYNLETITLPKNLTSIGEWAFANCYSFKNVIIPESVVSIDSYAFISCSALESITIPDGVTTVGASAFSNCTSLTIYCEAKSKPSGWSSNWNYSNCPVVWDYKNTMQKDIFTFKGYSFNEMGSMAVGFDIDYKAKAHYEEITDVTLDIGVVFAGLDLLNGQNPLDGEGKPITLDIGRVAQRSLTEFTYTYYDFVINGITTDELKNYKLVIAAYVFDGETVKYIQEGGISDTVSGITYNEAKGGQL